MKKAKKKYLMAKKANDLGNEGTGEEETVNKIMIKAVH